MEAKIRWKDNRNIPHLDLCRPFAAHCIGYPMVTLGFGFKSYIGYRIRQRKQREVAKENEFYMQLLQQALPQDEVNKNDETELVNGDSLNTSSTINLCKNTQQNQSQQQQQNGGGKTSNSNGSIDHHQLNGNVNTTAGSKQQNQKRNAEKENGCLHHNHNNHLLENNHHHHPQEIIPNNAILSKSSNTTGSKAANHLNFNNLQSVKNTNTTSYQQIQNGIASPMKELNVNVSGKCSPYKNKSDDHNTYTATTNKKEYEKEKIIKDSNSYEDTSSPVSTEPPSQKAKVKSEKQQQQQYHQTHQPATSANNFSEKAKTCEQCQRLEQETKRIKSEVQTIKTIEQELRQKYENCKGCLQTKQKEYEDMQKQ